MAEKANLITECWERSSLEEREEFLRELHKRYRLERICRALSTAADSELQNTFPYKENKQSF